MAKVNDYLRAHNYSIFEGLVLVNNKTGEVIEWFNDHEDAEEYIEELANKEEG